MAKKEETLSDQTTPEQAPGDSQSQPAPVPYDRFNEVVRERNKLRQDLEALNGRLAAREEAHKTASDQLAATLVELAAAKLAAQRTTAAVRAGLPIGLADRLQGTDEKELADDAARLAAFVKPSSPGVPPPGGGAPVLPLDIGRMSPAEIREHTRELMGQAKR